MRKYDVCIVGAGPSGIFTAIELIRLGSKKKIVIIEKGQPVEKRRCPKDKTGKCVQCKPYCHITTGFSGAGAFSDGKLSLYNPEDDEIHVGGILHEYIGVEETKKLIDYTDNIYLKFGADPHLEGIEYKDEVRKICNNFFLIHITVTFLLKEFLPIVYYSLLNKISSLGRNVLF